MKKQDIQQVQLYLLEYLRLLKITCIQEEKETVTLQIKEVKKYISLLERCKENYE